MRGLLLALALSLAIGVGCSSGGGSGTPTPTPTLTPTPTTFAAGVLPSLNLYGCMLPSCHGGTTIAQTGGLYLSGTNTQIWTALTQNAGADGKIAVNTVSPASSELLLKPDTLDTALNHTGGKVWSPSDVHYQVILGWIQAGAQNN